MLMAAAMTPARADDHPVEHIFFHPLMPSPRYTLHKGTQPAEFNKWMVTAREFRRILPQLYANDWVLVDIRAAVGKKPLVLPPGKKPLVISVDDLNYPQYQIDNHLNSKLVLDDLGRIASEYVTPDGTSHVSRSAEIVPLLDRFVERHPDFSLDGAKGTIALTGADGILGYRTSGRGPTAGREQAAVAPIVQRLAQTGWSFASHSYSHPDIAAISLAQVQKDTDRWEKYVEPLIGHNVATYVYPYGSFTTGDKLRYLRQAGFRIFCTIGPVASLTVNKGYVVQSRVHVDGMSLLSQQSMLKRFFDPQAVLDPVRPPL
jgi:hypothetical protein